MKKYSVVFIGTSAFGVPILKSLVLDGRFEIPFVITGEDKPSGRKMELTSPPVKEAALLSNLIVHQPLKIDDLKQKLVQAGADFLLVVSYGAIIRKEILNIPKYGAINIHPSLLPRYRGASPIQESLLHGDADTGVSWILMNAHMDQGDIVEQKKYTIDSADMYLSLHDKLSLYAAEQTPDVLVSFAEGGAKMPQDETQASYCRKITKEEGRIDFKSERAADIINKMRAYEIWPGCYFILNNKRIKLLNATVVEQKISPGEVLVTEGKMMIGTKEKSLEIKKIQSESKRAMSIEEFLRGNRDIPTS